MRVKIRVARSTDTIVQTVGLKDLTSNLARTKGMVLHFAGFIRLVVNSHFLSILLCIRRFAFLRVSFSDCELLDIYTTGVIDLAANPAKD